jgi:hypothetical protein
MVESIGKPNLELGPPSDRQVSRAEKFQEAACNFTYFMHYRVIKGELSRAKLEQSEIYQEAVRDIASKSSTEIEDLIINSSFISWRARPAYYLALLDVAERNGVL